MTNYINQPLDLNNEQMKMNLRIQENSVMLEQRTAKKIFLMKQKQLMKEEEREKVKAQFEAIQIDKNGNVSVYTQNLRIPTGFRRVVNFTNPGLIPLCRISNPDEKIFLFQFYLAEEIQYTMLLPAKCGSPTYLMKKIASVGGYVIGNTLAKRKEYLTQLVILMIENAEKAKYIPDRRGWYLDENGNLKFFQGHWTWEEAKKCAE